MPFYQKEMTRKNLSDIMNDFVNFFPTLKGKLTKFKFTSFRTEEINGNFGLFKQYSGHNKQRINFRNVIIWILLALLSVGCQTYKRSFGNTYTSINANSSKIYRLDLSNQNLSKIPKSISQCDALRMLNLSGNPDLDIDDAFNAISTPETLEVLILDSLQIDVLPQSINRFINLKHLSLNANPETDFDAIFDLVNELPIKFISLQQNELKSIPTSFSKLEKLKSVNFSNNQLGKSEDFKILSRLPELTSLWLTDNSITVLPAEISDLKGLRNLYLEHNLLKTLPEEIAQMPKVWVLHLGHNQFKELPVILTRMNSLLLLHINNNPIHSIPEAYATEKYSLMGLIIDNNELSDQDIKRWEKEFSAFFQASF